MAVLFPQIPKILREALRTPVGTHPGATDHGQHGWKRVWFVAGVGSPDSRSPAAQRGEHPFNPLPALRAIALGPLHSHLDQFNSERQGEAMLCPSPHLGHQHKVDSNVEMAGQRKIEICRHSQCRGRPGDLSEPLGELGEPGAPHNMDNQTRRLNLFVTVSGPGDVVHPSIQFPPECSPHRAALDKISDFKGHQHMERNLLGRILSENSNRLLFCLLSE